MKVKKTSFKQCLDALAFLSLGCFMVFQILPGQASAGFFAASFVFFAASSIAFPSKVCAFKYGVPEFTLILFLISNLFSIFLNSELFGTGFTALFWCFAVFISFLWGKSIKNWSVFVAIPGFVCGTLFFFWALVFGFDLSGLFSGKIYRSSFLFVVNPNRFAIILLVSLAFLTISFQHFEVLGGLKRYVVFALYVMVLVGVIGTGSRTGFAVAGFFGILVVARSRFKGRFFGQRACKFIARTLLVTSMFTVIGLIYLVLVGALYGSGRDVIWRVALDAWAGSPFFGLGFGQSARVLASENIMLSAHNAFVELLVEGGISAFILFFLFLGTVALKGCFRSGREPESVVLLLILFAFIFHQSFESLIFHVSPYSFMFFAFSGWVVERCGSYVNLQAQDLRHTSIARPR
ncbi:O-antigen ligase family protein [Marinobacter bohaiensis]|uniref:O-antigen ligase family protein n=1 Tax=Marinobacter bohaiensis TaxID=2201898 RepID=UPI0013A6BB87|nr:O-antigen ligase family protein [Marinobacter bohaiensis]